jgi:hypothetical protein
LRGGLNNGSFALFGDLEHQVLAERDSMLKSVESIRTTRPARWTLLENCRNYRIIGETAVQLAGLQGTIYTGYRRIGGGLSNYDILFYETESAQLDLLNSSLKYFGTQGYAPSEITILSFRRDENSAAATLRQAGYNLRPVWQENKCTGYASVQAFKGMENKVIILCDVVLTQPELHRDLFYTGLTRATECVRVLCARTSQKLLSTWITPKGTA